MKQKYVTPNYILLAALIIVEFLLFRTFVAREICNMVPSDVDQSVYLNQSYSIYRNIIESDYRNALALILNTANTGLPLLGVVMLFCFGQSRLSLLIPNFIGFAALQVIGYKTTNKVFGNEHAGWGYIGLLLLTNTTFGWAANIVSFRADFLFACLFAIWIILLFEAVFFEDNKVYLKSAIFAGIMLFIRFFAICFLAPIMLIEVILFFCSWGKIKKTFQHLSLYVGGVLAGGGWFFLINIANFVKYYLGAMTNDMKEIWQVQLSLIENLVYYPKCFMGYHMGKNLSITLLLVGAVCLIVACVKKIKLEKTAKKACLILASAFVVPYVMLMISNKQPLVISIWNGVFIFAILVGVGVIYQEYRNRVIKYVVTFFSFLFLIVGCTAYTSRVTGQFWGAYVKYSDIEDIWRLNGEIADWAVDNQKNEVNVILDRWNDVLSLDSLELCSMETNGTQIQFKYAIETMNSNFATQQFEENDINEGLHEADVIVVAKEGYNYESTFPTDWLFDLYRGDIYAYATENLKLLGSFDWRGNELQVYAKKSVTIETEWFDWLSIKNEINFNKEEGDEILLIEGDYMEGLYPELLVRALDAESSQELETVVEVHDGRYVISIDISGLTNQNNTIELSFESYYIPSEISDSKDSRQLTVLYPDKCLIKKGIKSYDQF